MVLGWTKLMSEQGSVKARLNGNYEMVKSLLANAVLLAPVFWMLITLQIDSAVAASQKEMNAHIDRIEQLIVASNAEIAKNSATLEKNGEVARLVKEQQDREHAYQNERLNSILEEVREIKRGLAN